MVRQLRPQHVEDYLLLICFIFALVRLAALSLLCLRLVDRALNRSRLPASLHTCGDSERALLAMAHILYQVRHVVLNLVDWRRFLMQLASLLDLLFQHTDHHALIVLSLTFMMKSSLGWTNFFRSSGNHFGTGVYWT